MAKIIPGEERGRSGYIVDGYDGAGRRVVRTFEKRELAKIFKRKLENEARRRPSIDPLIALTPFVEQHWLKEIAGRVKQSTLALYASNYRVHVASDRLGSERVYQLERGALMALLSKKRAEGLKPATVNVILGVLRAALTYAIDRGLITNNPAKGLGKTLGLAKDKALLGAAIKAMTAEQLGRFEAAAILSVYRVLFLTLARTGMRIGEGLALRWEDVDIQARRIRVERGVSHGHVDTPKGNIGRTVVMSDELAAALHLEYGKATRRTPGDAEPEGWVFGTEAGELHDDRVVRDEFAAVLKAAGLPRHFTPHCLRHTFSSLLLSRAENAQYVQQQLGHRTMALTVDLYGKWLEAQPVRGGVNALDRDAARHGNKLVAAGAVAPVSTASREDFVTVP